MAADARRAALHLASELGIAALLMVISIGMLAWYELPTIQLRDVVEMKDALAARAENSPCERIP